MLEDVEADAELIRRELSRQGLVFAAKRVEKEEEFLRELRLEPTLILADYTLPAYDGLSALSAACQKCPSVPFIFVSGTIGEDRATETLKMGATDYVLKDRLSKLGPAVRRALKEAEERDERKRAAAALAAREAQLCEAQRLARLGSWEWDVETGKLAWSDELFRIYGLTRGEFIPRYDYFLGLVHPADRARLEQAMKCAIDQKSIYELDHRVIRKDGAERVLHSRGEGVYTYTGNLIRIRGTSQDITERKAAEESLLKLDRELQYISGGRGPIRQLPLFKCPL